jgi:hypothetical protein
MATPVKKKRSTKKKQRSAYLVVPARLFAPERPHVFKYFFPPETFTPRRLLNIQDLMMFLGCSASTARRQIARIYKWKREPFRPYITVKSFCKFHKIEEQDVQEYFMMIHHWRFMEAIERRGRK